LKTAFKMFDIDNSGKIDTNEVHQLLAGDSYLKDYTKEQLTDVILAVDENGDGEIDYKEFIHMMGGV